MMAENMKMRNIEVEQLNTVEVNGYKKFNNMMVPQMLITEEYRNEVIDDMPTRRIMKY